MESSIDDYFPDCLVDKIKDEIVAWVSFLESGTKDLEKVQERLAGLNAGNERDSGAFPAKRQ